MTASADDAHGFEKTVLSVDAPGKPSRRIKNEGWSLESLPCRTVAEGHWLLPALGKMLLLPVVHRGAFDLFTL